MYSDTEAKLVAENRELRAEVDRLRAVVNDMGDLMADVRRQRDAATARAEAAEKEALDYIDYRNQAVISRNAMERRLEAAEALVAGLRGALETLNHAAKVAISTEYGGCFDEETPLVIRLLDGTCDETDAALALTPASAGNRIKAEAYREAARLVDSCSAETLHREADRLTAEAEKEPSNGK